MNSDLDGADKAQSTSKVSFTQTLQKVVDYLQGEPLLLFVLGAAIIMVGAGSLKSDSLTVLRIPLLVLIIFGIVAWLFLEVRKNPETHLRRSYGIKILSPEDGANCNDERVVVKGNYGREFPEQSLRLFTISTDGTRCWPQSIAILRPDKQWEAVVYLGGNPPDYTIGIVAAIVGNTTRILWNYYLATGRVIKMEPKRNRPPIEGWPSDAVKQNAIYVTRVFDQLPR